VSYRFVFTREASKTLKELESPGSQDKLKKVRRALGLLQKDPKYPSLSSHKYSSLKGLNNEEVFDSYVENHTPSAWRIFWHYGPGAGVITILMITPHP
jgi:hypothetical protein